MSVSTTAMGVVRNGRDDVASVTIVFALVGVVLSGCSEPERLLEFSSFDLVKSGAVERGCVERRWGRDFTCDRIVGTACDCKVTLHVEPFKTESNRERRAGISWLKITARFCPRSTGATIANELLAPAIGGPDQTEVARFIAEPGVDIKPGTHVDRYKRFGNLDLFVMWDPVLANLEPRALATPDLAETLHIYALPRDREDVSNEPPLEVSPWPSPSPRYNLCPDE